ncbi:MAG: hypothetical protein J7L82_06275, partial [Staphylothermus sp.]|nr:hypothetical protein [Staphylothermus sp.]
MINWYKLEFTTPVHIGERGVGIESVTTRLHSTTLHAAIMNALIMLGKLEPKLDDETLINVASSFRVTTPSPYIYSKHPLYWINGVHVFLSRNITNKIIHYPRIYNRIIRALKRVNLATPYFFNEELNKCQIICEDMDSCNNIEIQCDKRTYEIIETDRLHGNIIIEKGVVEKTIYIAEQIIRPKNIIDRVTNASNPYYIGLIQYYKPLIMGVEIVDEKCISLKDVEDALKLVSEIGLGGKRTYGFGEFRYSKVDMAIGHRNNFRTDKKTFVVQGLFTPGLKYMAEILEKSIYTIKIHGSRSGFTGAIRKPIITLSEGSIIECTNNCKGLIVVDEDGFFSKIVRSFDPVKVPFNIHIG